MHAHACGRHCRLLQALTLALKRPLFQCCLQSEEAAKRERREKEKEHKQKKASKSKQQPSASKAASEPDGVEKQVEGELEGPPLEPAVPGEAAVEKAAEFDSLQNTKQTACAAAAAAAASQSSSAQWQQRTLPPDQQQQRTDRRAQLHQGDKSRGQQKNLAKGRRGVDQQQQTMQPEGHMLQAQGGSGSSSSDPTDGHDVLNAGVRASTNTPTAAAVCSSSNSSGTSEGCGSSRSSSSSSNKGVLLGQRAAVGAGPSTAAGSAGAPPAGAPGPSSTTPYGELLTSPLAGSGKDMFRNGSPSAGAPSTPPAAAAQPAPPPAAAAFASLLPPHLAGCLGGSAGAGSLPIAVSHLPSAGSHGNHHQEAHQPLQQQQEQQQQVPPEHGGCRGRCSERPRAAAPPRSHGGVGDGVGMKGSLVSSKPRRGKMAAKPKPGECVVCLDAFPCVLLLPCKHLVLCEGCLKGISGGVEDCLMCPMCREPVEQHIVGITC